MYSSKLWVRWRTLLAAAPAKKKKQVKSDGQPAGPTAASAIHVSRKQRQQIRKQNSRVSDQPGRDHVSSGVVQKKKGGKFAQKKQHTSR